MEQFVFFPKYFQASFKILCHSMESVTALQKDFENSYFVTVITHKDFGCECCYCSLAKSLYENPNGRV